MHRLLALALVALVPAVAAQPLGRLLPPDRTYASVNVLHGVPSPSGTGPLLSIVTVAARTPLTDRLTAHVEMPIGIEDLDFESVCGPLDCQDEVRVGLANPYVGVETSLPAGTSAELGVWLPLATGRGGRELSGSEPASTAGLYLDRERPEAYDGGVTSVALRLRGVRAFGEGVSVEAAVTPIVSFFERTPARPQDRLALRAEALGAIRLDAVDLSLGFAGHYRDDKVFDALDATLVVGVAGDVGAVRPGLALRVPVSGYLITDSRSILELSLDVPLR